MYSVLVTRTVLLDDASVPFDTVDCEDTDDEGYKVVYSVLVTRTVLLGDVPVPFDTAD